MIPSHLVSCENENERSFSNERNSKYTGRNRQKGKNVGKRVDHIGSSDRGTASDERNPFGIFPYLRVRYFSDDGSRCNRRDADGPKAGAWLGLIFGATSFYQAVTGSSAFSTMLFNINPIYAFLLCIPTRVLMGFLTGVIFKAAQKVDKKKTVCYFVGGFFAAFLNTLFFMGVLLICYWNTEFIQGINETLGGLNPLMFVVAFVGVNGALEMPSSCIVGGIVSKAVNRALYTKKEA